MSFQEYSGSLRGKLHLGEVNKKAIAGIMAILGIALIMLCVGLGSMATQGTADALVVKWAEPGDGESREPAAAEASEHVAVHDICVHIGGCVAIPGVISLGEGARVADAVAAAGGLTADAASDTVNLARVVEDGEQIIVPSLEQVQASAQASAPSIGVQGEGATNTAGQGTASGKVNLNTASSTELQTLSGIGASKAQKIIAYRDSNGAFKSVDDLTKVSGIGEKTLEAIRDQICV